MAQGFNSPGVSVTEIPSPAIAPGGSSPTIVALVGTAQGYEPYSERLTVSGIATQTLGKTGVVGSSVVVKKGDTLQTLSSGSYVVVQSSDPDGVASSGDEIFTIRRVAVPASAPTAAAGSAGGLTASVGVTYAIAYMNAGGGETGLGTVSNSLIVAAKQVELTSIPVSADASITKRVIYRKVQAPDGDGLWHKLDTINDNVTTTFTDTGATVHSEATVELNKQEEVTLSDGGTIAVSYNYADTTYYEPEHFDDYNDFITKYGDPFNSSTGAVNSDLSFAARLAFANGASEVVGVAAKTSGTLDFTNAMDKLKDEQDVTYVIPVSGTAAIHTLAQAHCTFMSTNGFYRSAIVGRDGSSSAITAATLRAAAAAYNDEKVIHVSPAAFELTNPVTGKVQVVGAHFVAPAVAGMLQARDPQVPLTRKPFAVFTDVHDRRTQAEKSLDELSGLFVVENKGGVIRCFHSLTTAAGSVNTREVSVVRVKYEMARRLRDSLDRGVVGQVIPRAEIGVAVNATVRGLLASLVSENMIAGFANISSRPTSDPTVVEVRFEYEPLYPVNRVEVKFRINTENGVFQP